MSHLWDLSKRAYAEWSEDKAPRLAAALAYYTMLSIAPLLIISLKIVGAVFGEEAARGQIETYVRGNVGPQGAEAVEQMIANAGKDDAGIVAALISTVVLLFSASGVFGELQDSLNTIWEVKPKPDRSWGDLIRERFFSFTLVLGTAFILLVSLVVSAVVAGATERFAAAELGMIWTVLHFAISVTVVTVLFALIFKYIPDVKVPWRDVWFGAAVTAVLFSIGKLALGWYLGRGSTTSLYGAAGSLVALLIWVYYAAQILFFGAEITQVHAHARAGAIAVSDNAVPVTAEERAQQGIPRRSDVEDAARSLDRPATAERGRETRVRAPRDRERGRG